MHPLCYCCVCVCFIYHHNNWQAGLCVQCNCLVRRFSTVWQPSVPEREGKKMTGGKDNSYLREGSSKPPKSIKAKTCEISREGQGVTYKRTEMLSTSLDCHGF